jgi:hypothetical protein
MNEFLEELEKARKLMLKREKLLEDRAKFSNERKDYTSEAIYVLASEILEVEKLLITLIITQTP